jgi:predicted DNA-binding transcriptional regulator YafY
MSRLKSSERRMKMILLLQDSNKKITVDKMAETFGVSRRTIFRDLRALSEINVPVTWEEYSGYGIMPGYKVPPLMFTSKELATIMVGLNFVKSQIDQTLVDDAKGVELKIRNILPDELKEFMESLNDRTVVDPFLHFGVEKKKGGSWYLISSAISQNKSIRFGYHSIKDGKKSNREVDPYLLVFYRDHWNVIGFSKKRDDIRNFVLNRMRNIEITDEIFEPATEIDAEALIFRSGGSENLIRVSIEESAYRRFKANLPTKIFKEIKENSKIIKVSFYFDNLDFINEWLLQFGDKVKIDSPKVLIDKRNSILNKMNNDINIK